MDQYEMVRTAHRVYKKSIRQIARETGHTRRTVQEGVGRAGAEVSAGEGAGLSGDGSGGRDRGGLAAGGSGAAGQAATHGAPGVATSGGRAWIYRSRADGAAMGAGAEDTAGLEPVGGGGAAGSGTGVGSRSGLGHGRGPDEW